jgi:ABC-2 type transport system permease protein
MRKILAIVKREYLQIVRTKGFIIGTVLGPVLMVAIVAVPVLVSLMSVDKPETLGVIDFSGRIYQELDSQLDVKLRSGEKQFDLELYKGPDPEILRRELNQKVLDKELDAYIFIPTDIFEGGMAEFNSEHVSDFVKIRNISETISRIVVANRLNSAGLNPEEIAKFTEKVAFKTNKISERGVEEDTGGTFLISYILVLLLYTTLFFYGSIILRGVIEEKSSRVVEIMLSSVKPFQMMMGKLLGIAAVGFTQYAIWALFGALATGYAGSLTSGLASGAEGFKIPSIPAYVFIYFVVFFVLGFFLYGTLYAAIGSMVNNEKEAQSLIFPISMFLIVPVLMMSFVIRAPGSSLSIGLSMVPFFAPILMLMRISILMPPAPQIIACILLMILTIFLMIWLVARIYRVGILMYGKRPSLPEILKWLRYR